MLLTKITLEKIELWRMEFGGTNFTWRQKKEYKPERNVGKNNIRTVVLAKDKTTTNWGEEN